MAEEGLSNDEVYEALSQQENLLRNSVQERKCMLNFQNGSSNFKPFLVEIINMK